MSTLEEQFGAMVRYHRKRVGLSQAQLAELSDRQPNAIQRLENGETAPTFDTVVRVAEALKVEIWELFYSGGFEVKPHQADPLAAIFRQIVGLKDGELQKIHDLISVALTMRK